MNEGRRTINVMTMRKDDINICEPKTRQGFLSALDDTEKRLDP